mmetsp:Transcript_16684/g.31642  ORF Transcript_16684/g.31642 Transcript_16684/m.31642 type:complete len:86 (+) Transcript_16684:574-831(+)
MECPLRPPWHVLNKKTNESSMKKRRKSDQEESRELDEPVETSSKSHAKPAMPYKIHFRDETPAEFHRLSQNIWDLDNYYDPLVSY